ncbi:GAF domain-containing protein [Roseivirga sp. BDSF3-8]|uniref:GAF domain-containing protein n=1 Tax=Roseivirga sp. BDSF3-8 TaxID=3241598 RepID=UPI0035318EA8
MKKFRFTIGNKILFGFLLLIGIFVGNSAINYYTLLKNDQVIRQSSEVVNPSTQALEDFHLMITRSKMLVTNWVYLQNNVDDKEALKVLHEEEYPELRDRLLELSTKWEDKQQKSEVDSMFTDFETLLNTQEWVMNTLVSFDDYEDFTIKWQAADSIENAVLPRSQALIDDLKKLKETKGEEERLANASIIKASDQLQTTNMVLALLILGIGLSVAWLMSRSITRPINTIKALIAKLGKGELPDKRNTKASNDEIGEMAVAVDALVDGLRSTSSFAENIGKGNYHSDYSPLSENDVLGNALIEMRDNLQKVAEEDKRRNWATEGMAKFGEILRKHTNNLEELSDQVISSLVKYMNANQGGLFILKENSTDNSEEHLSLAACYAWDKKKYLDQQVLKGEGLAGQAWMEKDTVYVTEIPQDYIKITSGLGESNPSSILIVPLKVNDEVYGVIELASFHEFKEFEIEFVEKIAESIASSISAVRINEKTQYLLSESTELTEQMRAQEEEMRQNMEELQATQEEMQRAQRDREEKERIIDHTHISIETDASLAIRNMNSIAKNLLGSSAAVGSALQGVVLNGDALNSASSKLQDGKEWSGVLTLKTANGDQSVVNFGAGQAQDPYTGETRFLFFGMKMSEAKVVS